MMRLGLYCGVGLVEDVPLGFLGGRHVGRVRGGCSFQVNILSSLEFVNWRSS